MNFYKLLGLIFIYIFSFWVTNATETVFNNPTLWDITPYDCLWNSCFDSNRIVEWYWDNTSWTKYCIALNWTFLTGELVLWFWNGAIFSNIYQLWTFYNSDIYYYNNISCDISEPPTETWSTNTWITLSGSTIIINNYDDTPIFTKDFLDDVYISILVIVSIFLWVRFFYILK